jgi:hypothetical protein
VCSVCIYELRHMLQIILVRYCVPLTDGKYVFFYYGFEFINIYRYFSESSVPETLNVKNTNTVFLMLKKSGIYRTERMP